MPEGRESASIEGDNLLFRFRSVDALLDKHAELEKQEIFFARPESLNDPMEGLTDAFWDGDDVLWENLFRNYALALIWYTSIWLIRDKKEISDLKVRAWLTTDDLPTDSFRELYGEFCNDFCKEINVRSLSNLLAQVGLPLRRERLRNLLFLVHPIATTNLFRVLKKHKLCDFSVSPMGDAASVSQVVQGWVSIAGGQSSHDMNVEDQLEIMGRILNSANHQLELGFLSRRGSNGGAKWIALVARFPDNYIDACLTELHFSPWRTACFSRRCVNASMWGTYGHEHKGVALVFRTTERSGKRFFRVRGMLGTGPKGNDLEAQPVTYRKRPPPLDSFLSMGMLPMGKLADAWMSDSSGKKSRRLCEMTDDMDAWRKHQWAKAFERATWKHPDWEHEEEVRLIATTPFTDDPAPKPLKYEFSQLEGIVFGMRTTTVDKLRIAKVLEKKCRDAGRSDFRFFQAYYSPQKGEMETAELTLLSFGGTSQ